MSLLKLFGGPSPEKLERRGDALLEAGLWGKAKLEYERAYDKLQKSPPVDGNLDKRIAAKIDKSREALAKEHHRNAADLIEAGCFEEAGELLALAVEMTADEAFKKQLEEKLLQTRRHRNEETDQAEPDLFYGLRDDNEEPQFEDRPDEEYFFALCSTLPDEVKEAYEGYGQTFKTGYLALNRGDFDTAAHDLYLAIEENDRQDSYIAFELATAYVHLGKTAEAQGLLENFLKYHPETLPAYQLLCEIYWEKKEFLRAEHLLASVPQEYGKSLAFFILKGETLYQSGRYETARDYYRDFLDSYGWHDTVALELAKTHEALGEPGKARLLYKEMIARCKDCSSCHTRIDPAVKHKYAELCFAEGMAGAEVLELYLALARELPDHASLYFDRISRIYEKQGNAAESRRFRAFSRQALKKE